MQPANQTDVQHNETSSQATETLSFQEHQCVVLFFQMDKEVIPTLADQYKYTLLLNLVN